MSESTEDCGCGNNSQSKPAQSTVLSRILNKVFVSETEKEIRMSLCRGCEHFESATVQCKVCGCFLEAKTRLKMFHCALDQLGQEPKW